MLRIILISLSVIALIFFAADGLGLFRGLLGGAFGLAIGFIEVVLSS